MTHEIPSDVELNNKIVEIIEEQLGASIEDIIPGAHIVNDLGADSLDIVELVVAVEEEFNIEIPDERAAGSLDNDPTVAEVTAFVKAMILEDRGVSSDAVGVARMFLGGYVDEVEKPAVVIGVQSHGTESSVAAFMAEAAANAAGKFDPYKPLPSKRDRMETVAKALADAQPIILGAQAPVVPGTNFSSSADTPTTPMVERMDKVKIEIISGVTFGQAVADAQIRCNELYAAEVVTGIISIAPAQLLGGLCVVLITYVEYS